MPPRLARLAFSASILIVMGTSNRLTLCAVALHPGEDFLRPKAPVLAEAISREAICCAFPQMSVDPRDGNPQERRDLRDRKELSCPYPADH